MSMIEYDREQGESMEHKIEFWCDTCHVEQPMNTVECINHLRVFHKVKNLTGTRVLLLTAEGEMYQNTYELEIGGVKITQINTGPRTGAG